MSRLVDTSAGLRWEETGVERSGIFTAELKGSDIEPGKSEVELKTICAQNRVAGFFAELVETIDESPECGKQS